MSIIICFTGDIMLGRDTNVGNTFDSKFEQTIFGSTLPILSKCDLVIGNLETTITDHDEKYKKVFNYRVNPKHAHLLKINQNMFLSIANNHILDYKEQGMYDTINNLKKLQIAYSGAGSNLHDSRSHATLNIKGKRIGIIGCADHYDYWKSGSNNPGINYVNYKNYTGLMNHIRKIKQNLDILIMSIHWGPNYHRGIEEKYQKFAKDMLSAGVDIVHGHSSHHVKCIRHNGKKLIIYGMGDFVDDYAVDDEYRNDLGMIVKVILDTNHNIKVSVIPTKIKDRQVNVLPQGPERNYVCQVIQSDCDKPVIAKDYLTPKC